MGSRQSALEGCLLSSALFNYCHLSRVDALFGPLEPGLALSSNPLNDRAKYRRCYCFGAG